MPTDQKTTTEPANVLSDRSWAYKQVIERANSVTLTSAEQESLKQVDQWVHQVDAILKAVPAEQIVPDVPQLGLTWAQLDDLVMRVVIDQQPDPKRRHELTLRWHNVERLHHQSKQLRVTSGFVAAGLLFLGVLNIVELLALKGTPRSSSIELNLLVVGVVFILWAWHHFASLRPHLGFLEEHILSVLSLHKPV